MSGDAYGGDVPSTPTKVAYWHRLKATGSWSWFQLVIPK